MKRKDLIGKGIASAGAVAAFYAALGLRSIPEGHVPAPKPTEWRIPAQPDSQTGEGNTLPPGATGDSQNENNEPIPEP
ncbi:hypothetical protein [Robiginitalea sediminis]|uniref:hypothetical protein n=1 Tax=Robiginitalea sediminis TaxID=1982593 RepID=UPI000B4BA77E|nr:hypothetical protein [Robiginitalea sediminis]